MMRWLRLRSVGFEAVELAGFGGLPAAEFAELLRRHGLTAIALHVSLDRLRHDRGALLADAATLGVTDPAG